MRETCGTGSKGDRGDSELAEEEGGEGGDVVGVGVNLSTMVPRARMGARYSKRWWVLHREESCEDSILDRNVCIIVSCE